MAKHLVDGTVPEYEPNGLRGEGVPLKPRGLPRLASRVWDELEPHIVQWGACEGDSVMFAEMCRLYASYRTAHGKGNVNTAMKYWNAFKQIAASFGLTPADRAKLEVKGAGSDDDREGKFYGVVG